MASLLAWWAQAGPLARRPAHAWPLASSALAVADAARYAPADTVYKPSRRPRVGARDRPGSPLGQQRRESPLVLPLPPNVKLKVAVDDSLRNFDVQEKVGEAIDYRDPSRLTYKEYEQFQQRQAIRNYYRERARGGITGPAVAAGTPQAQRLIPKIDLGPVGDRIFGGRYVDIRPAGAVSIKAGAKFNVNENPALTLRQQRVGDFIFDQSMNINLTGQVGTKLKLAFNYDTKASFDFDNQMKFDYSGQETDIIRKIDLGNVSLPLGNSLVQGGQNLFGAKAQLQFGRLGVTAVAATVRGTADEVRVQNGAQSRQFELKASQYEKDKHFFLSHYFRERYDQALRNLPTIQSGVQVTQLEVYVTNDNRTTASLRNVVALMDIAEPLRFYRQRFLDPSRNATGRTPAENKANLEYAALVSGGAQARNDLTADSYLAGLGLAKNLDYERVRARKLDPNEYTFNAELGYVSLNTTLLPDQALGVSYSYIYNGRTYKVGETVQDYGTVSADQVIFLKLLRATNPGIGTLPTARPDPLVPPGPPTRNTPTWDLMMKNVYSLNTTQLNRDNFQLQIIYKDDVTGVDLISLKEGAKIQNTPLIQVLGLDRVNPNNDRNPDGNFDFFPGVTVNPELGRIIFPSVQPFGDYLRAQFDTTGVTPGANAANERALLQKYVYNELYTQTQSDAQQRQEKDKFYLRGRYQGTTTDEISLPGIGVAQGSVRVFSGSTLLTEGTDYQVFYDQAKVKILNPSYLASANELRITFEKNALVQVQPRRLVGTRFDYRMNRDVTLGGTALYLLENQAPGINRVNIGDEPANNSIVGVDGSIRKDSRVLTKLLDRLPFYSTKEISTFAFSGEFAKLLAGKSQLGSGENGTSYVDDFENARTPYTLGGLTAIPAWRLATTPATISRATDLSVNYQRAKLAWYTVDQTYYTGGPSVPANIAGDLSLSNHYTRGIPRNEVFPNKDLGATGNGYEYTFDMAYFPGERGPYNYTPNIQTDGQHFADNTGANLPENRFGGISRGITFDTDFDNANIEYLEFWMLDPFLPGTNGKVNDSSNPPTNNTSGGRLVINLGNVSEDLLRDSNQHEFENGLPTPDLTDTTGLARRTIWGRVGKVPFLTDAFSAAPGARAVQDVGLDGLNDVAEQALVAQAGSNIAGIYSSFADPAADDFRYHLDGFYDANNVKILGRYKNYNGYEGNSPEGSQATSTAYPDKEDLNRDNVIQDVEQYHEYSIPLGPNGSTTALNVGQNYIIDKVTTPPITGSGGESVTWYQFRIPIRDPNQRIVMNGATSTTDFGYKSIRFIRMYMTGWQQPVVLRLVQPQFVANQWRRYNYPIAQAQSNLPVNITTDARAFSISTVSVEENGQSATPGAIPYVTPPNIIRDTEYGSSAVARVQNEQSLRLSVTGLSDGYAKAAYKNLTVNMLRYKRLRMYLHADSDDPNIKDGDVRGFVRIGTDYTQNYYEYSVPLVVTRAGQTTQSDVWPVANNIDVAFQDFIDAKSLRNKQSPPNYLVPFTVTLPSGATVTVVGNPDFSTVQGCMIGILNPTSADVGAKSVSMWADELRVYDFEQQAGYAANARMNVKLADLATVTATGSFTSIGFGGLQDKVQQRSLDDVLRGDLNAVVAADKLLPAQLHLRVPVLLQVGAERRAPEYDPLDPDTKLRQSLEKFTDANARADYSKKVIDMTTTRSLSLLNVRKERVVAAPPIGGGPAAPPRQPKPWDIENIALSYSIAERQHSDVRTASDYSRSFQAAAAYTFQTTPKNYMPFAQVKVLSNPYLKFLQQVNFTPLPSRFAFRIDLDRRYNERFLQRVVNPGEVPSTFGIPGVYQKSFYINRIYDLSWALTKALTIDYTATNRGVIDEGVGRSIGTSQEALNNRTLIRQNLLTGGRTTNFFQKIAATYRLPLDKFPLTDWLSSDVRYAANYTWQAASTALRSPNPKLLSNGTADPTDTTTVALALGNTIQNNAEISANGRIDLVKLYNKVRFLNIINNAPPPAPRPAPPAPGAPDAAGTRPKPDAAAPRDTTPVLVRAVKAVLRSLMTARSLNFTYARSSGTLLPGYLPGTTAFGLTDYRKSGILAPGIPFVIGKQYDLRDLYDYANRNGWYTGSSEYLNTPFSSLLTENLTLRTTLEPFRDFLIQVDARRQKVQNSEAYYRNQLDTLSLLAARDPAGNKILDPKLAQSLTSGSFSTSTITINTLFNDLSANGEVSKAFARFVDNRGPIQARLQAAADAQNTGLNTPLRAYSYNSQDVLIPAFIDAYHGRSSNSYQAKKFNLFDQLPLPNWNIGYNGLSQLPFFRDYFASFTLNHAYNSSYNVGSYTSSTLYTNNDLDFPNRASATGQYIPYYVIGQVSIVEHLAPLIGVNFQTLNKVTGRVEYRTDRLLSLNTTNAQVTELHTTALVIGFGYVTAGLKLPFRVGGEQRVLKNTLNVKLDLSINDNTTIQRSIVNNVDPANATLLTPASVGTPSSQIVNGARTFQLRPTVDYLLNTRLNLQFYYTQTITTPRVSNAFRNATTEGGLLLRYSLTQ
ncbi:cell surface protein SprA [Hymenobacter nivis]|uniref:Cell surface protein SprA n=1 Tax=Hymenobacter nivis TaxID=1850093 RepID=A0A2Z3GQY9_9BACT|nr:cell surface protein SprA [Hymenobacter nivis]AWM33726.1 cell surface protein SprA [Hymenobacter nivis]